MQHIVVEYVTASTVVGMIITAISAWIFFRAVTVHMNFWRSIGGNASTPCEARRIATNIAKLPGLLRKPRPA
jgi:multisubunit Na+/H+ antiporter MnhE subunit